MLKTRVIPVLLLKNGGFYKGIKFKNHQYVGDPINTIKIFNEKEVDELVILDFTASIEGRSPDFSILEKIAGEAFIPMGYGGGLKNIDQIDHVFSLGFEKVVLNTYAMLTPELIENTAKNYGSQSVVVSIDAKKNILGSYSAFIRSGTENIKKNPVEAAKIAVDYGAGEIIINSIDKDGTMDGYDLSLIQMVADAVKVPVIASGGAKTVQDFVMARKVHASAVAAGAMFVYHGPHRAVLISYPKYKYLEQELGE